MIIDLIYTACYFAFLAGFCRREAKPSICWAIALFTSLTMFNFFVDEITYKEYQIVIENSSAINIEEFIKDGKIYQYEYSIIKRQIRDKLREQLNEDYKNPK